MLTSRECALVATSLVLAVGTIVSVSVQLERQYKTVGWLNASKWFLVISAFFALVMTSLVCAAAAKGLGAPISTIEFLQRESLQKLLIAAFPPYFLCNMFVKHAWLTFYYGLARTRAQTYFIHFMQIIAAGFGISSVLVILMQCLPLNVVWHQYVSSPGQSPAKCINLIAFFYANSIIMIVSDIVMYLMPIVLLRNVDMQKPQRWGVYALFALGGLVVVASILRLVAIIHVDKGGNVSENYAEVYLWAAVENHVGICAACGGAIKQKSIAAVRQVKRSYSHLRSKSYSYRSSLAPSSPLALALARTQSAEDRILYERTDSLPESLKSASMEAGSGLSPDTKTKTTTTTTTTLRPTFLEMHPLADSPAKIAEYKI